MFELFQAISLCFLQKQPPDTFNKKDGLKHFLKRLENACVGVFIFFLNKVADIRSEI